MEIAITILVLVLLISAFFEGTLPKKYKDRNCMGKRWKQLFPATENETIREFLLLFVDAFAFRDSQILKFEPSDKLMDIYDAVTSNWGIDSLEFETLSRILREKYSIELADIWHSDLTLGELFGHVSKNA